MTNFREGLCQLVATAQLARATEKEQKSQLTRVRHFTEACFEAGGQHRRNI